MRILQTVPRGKILLGERDILRFVWPSLAHTTCSAAAHRDSASLFLTVLLLIVSCTCVCSVEANDYRQAPGPSYRILKAKRLYDRYISAHAQLQVNVPSWVARELTAILTRDGGGAASLVGQGGTPGAAAGAAASAPTPPGGPAGSLPSDLTASSPLLFIAAQREIFLLILNDSLKPFMESQPWRNYKLSCQAKVTY